MNYLIVTAPNGYKDTLSAVLESHEISQLWWEPALATDANFTVRFICRGEREQKLQDNIQKIIAGADGATLNTIKIDSSFPAPKLTQSSPKLSRDELIVIADVGARPDSVYLLLVALSTMIATIGLIQNNVPVVIGAMVIAPLLGPNLSIALAISLGETAIARSALFTLVKGVGLTFAMSYAVGRFWPTVVTSDELLVRTHVDLGSAILALGSGTAAVLSISSGVSGVLVGVMVAVALLPPLATSGILLGQGEIRAGTQALLLFAVNVAAINLAAHFTFLVASVRPRLASMAATARKNGLLFTILWLITLVSLLYTVTLRT